MRKELYLFIYFFSIWKYIHHSINFSILFISFHFVFFFSLYFLIQFTGEFHECGWKITLHQELKEQTIERTEKIKASTRNNVRTFSHTYTYISCVTSCRIRRLSRIFVIDYLNDSECFEQQQQQQRRRKRRHQQQQWQRKSSKIKYTKLTRQHQHHQQTHTG